MKTAAAAEKPQPFLKPLLNNVFDTALIFEGGGMRGAYTAGFVNVLLNNNIFFDNVYALSAGSSNAINYLSRDTKRARAAFVDLVKIPGFGGWRSFLRGKGWFSAQYIYEEIGKPGGCFPLDFKTFCANPAKVTIQGFEADTGKSVYWTRKDMTSVEALLQRVRASSTLPLAMPPRKIDGHIMYDGGLGIGAGFLLPRAQFDGFKRFVIVRTRPRAYRKTPSRGFVWRFTRAAMCHYPYVISALETRWERYNTICDEIEALEQQGDAYVFYPRSMNVESGTINYEKLKNAYNAGYEQASEELASLKNFVGLQ